MGLGLNGHVPKVFTTTNGRPGRTESARRYLRGELVHPSFFSVSFRVTKHCPLKLFQHKRRIKSRFLSIKVVRSLFRIYRFMSESSKAVVFFLHPEPRKRHWLLGWIIVAPPSTLIPQNGNIATFREYTFSSCLTFSSFLLYYSLKSTE